VSPGVLSALVCGAGVGSGLWLVVRGLFPPRPSLAQALAQLRRVPDPAPLVAAEPDGGLAARLGLPIARLLGRSDARWLVPGKVRQDLAVLGRSPERHLAEKATLALVGLLVTPAVTVLLALGGVHLSLVVPVWASLVLLAGGFFLPDLGIRTEAARRRTDFRHALSSFLDLVVVALAGGGGVETALADAASVGSGWAFDNLRQALDHARLARDPLGGARAPRPPARCRRADRARRVGRACGHRRRQGPRQPGGKGDVASHPPARRGRDRGPGRH